MLIRNSSMNVTKYGTIQNWMWPVLRAQARNFSAASLSVLSCIAALARSSLAKISAHPFEAYHESSVGSQYLSSSPAVGKSVFAAKVCGAIENSSRPRSRLNKIFFIKAGLHGNFTVKKALCQGVAWLSLLLLRFFGRRTCPLNILGGHPGVISRGGILGGLFLDLGRQFPLLQ
jgi:hypothetical protein